MLQYVQKIGIAVPIGILAYFTPLTELAFAVGFFVLADTATGIWASKVEGKLLHSRITRQIVAKIIAYLSALILSFVFDNHILQLDDIWTTRATAFILSSIEIQSNFENLYRATGLKLWNRLKHLFRKDEFDNGKK